jgi:hypothetical protein
MADNNGNADKKMVEGKEGGDPKKAAQGGGADTGVSTTTSTKGAGDEVSIGLSVHLRSKSSLSSHLRDYCLTSFRYCSVLCLDPLRMCHRSD